MADGPKWNIKRELIAEQVPQALFCDGYDDAIIGIAERFGMPPVVAYDYDRVIATLVAGGSSYEEAVEFFDFNIIGAWMGDCTPLFVRRLPGEQNKA